MEKVPQSSVMLSDRCLLQIIAIIGLCRSKVGRRTLYVENSD